MKTQHAKDLGPSCGIRGACLALGLGFAAVLAVSFGPAWLVVPVVIVYVAMVG